VATLSRIEVGGPVNRNQGFTTLELALGSAVALLATLILGTSIRFFSSDARQHSMQIEQNAQAQAFLQLLKKDLTSASDIISTGGFQLQQKVLRAGKVVQQSITYTIGAPTTCTTSNQKSFSCVKVYRQVESNAPAELPNVVAFRWCSVKLNNTECTALSALNQPLPATNARFIGQVEFLAYPDRPVGKQTRIVNFVFEAGNIGSPLQVLKTE
jgi:hypothetical protein